MNQFQQVMAMPQNNLTELLRHKNMAVATKSELVGVVSILSTKKYLSDSERHALSDSVHSLYQLRGFENEIDKHLLKFLS